RVTHEEIAGKDRRLDDARFAVTPRPHGHLREEGRERLGSELLHHETFAVAARPDRVPLVAWQGFAPFGLRRPIRRTERFLCWLPPDREIAAIRLLLSRRRSRKLRDLPGRGHGIAVPVDASE